MSPGIPTRLLATQSDQRLLALVREGHERAFEALVQRYRKPLLCYCRRLRLSDARGEDIVQLALLKSWIAVREGAEVRDLKAWLYRVVHNTAVNALRDCAHEGEPLADLTHQLETGESEFGRRLAMREALAEVAALPPLQREVIVRTAMAGHSHEQVASDLGITNGAVRGLLYRARATLRTAITALTPPPLLGWLAGRSDQSGPAPERLTELAGGGGAAGLGGLLLKGGVVAVTAGTVITGAAVVHLGGSTHHRDRHASLASVSASARTDAAGSASADAYAGARHRGLPAAGPRTPHGARGGDARRPAGAGGRITASGRDGSSRGSLTVPDAVHAPRLTGRPTGNARGGSPVTVQIDQSATPPSTAGQGSSPATGSSQGGESGAAPSGPVGSAAGNGSASGAGAGGSSEPGAAETGGAPSGGDRSGSGSGGQESAGSTQGGSSGTSGSEPSGGSSGEQSGSLVGTVVHEVGSILEHVLH